MRTWHCLAAIAAAVLLAFSNSLDNGLVGFDDTATLRGELGGHAALRKLDFSNPLRALPDLFTRRHLTNLSKTLDFALWGEDWWGHHLTNVLLHLGAAWAAYFAAAALLGSPAAALAAALIFALHPVQAEAVAYLAGRRDVLSGLLSLASFALWVRGRRRWAFAVWLVALTAKQSAVTVPLLWLAAGGGSRALLGVAGAAAAALVARHLFFEGEGAIWHGGSFARQLALEPRVLITALRCLVWPFGLQPDYNGAIRSGGLPWWLLLAAVAAAAWRWARSRPEAAFGLLWIAATYAPMIHALPTPHNLETFSEHWLYLPVFGLGLIAAWMAPRASLAAAVALGAAVYARNPIWRDPATFWSAAAKACPTCARPRGGLAQAAFEAGDRAAAERLWRQAISIDPDDPRAYLSLSVLLIDARRFEEAEEVLRRARALPLGRGAFHGQIQHNLGLIELRRGRVREAIPLFRSAGTPDGAHASGWCWQKLGNRARAEQLYRHALAANPSHLPALLDLAALGVPDAAELLERAVRLAPGRVDLKVAWARALTAKGEHAAAQRVLAALPRGGGYWLAQAELDVRRGFKRAAVRSAERAVALDNSVAAYRVLAEAHALKGR